MSAPSAGRRYLVGIDLGSTSLKAVIYDLAGNVVASGSRPTERFHPDPAHPDWTVWDPAQIWGGTAAATREAVAGLDDPGAIAAVAVTGMGMDGVPVDQKGKWLYPFISWLCPRTEPQRQWWSEQIGAEKTFSIGGNSLWAFSTALRLLWMAEKEPQVLARTKKWLLIEDFLNFMLCGKQATDYSMASCTLLFDQKSRIWSREMLGLSGIDGRLLCDPLPSGTVLGEVNRAAAEATGLPAGTAVVLGGHDYLCGALPAGALAPGVFLDVSGTWEVVQATIPGPVLSPELQRIGATVECHVARNMYSAMGAAISAEMLEWYRREFGAEARAKAAARGCADWETLSEEAAASPLGSNGVLFLPHMGGSGCPVVDSRSRGGFVGLAMMATRGDMLRSVIEGLDYQLLDIIQQLGANIGFGVEKLICVGGAARNPFWMQNKADVIGRAIEVSHVEDASPLGAAMLAGIGVGLYRDEQDAFEQVRKPGSIYEPDLSISARYAEWFPIYKSVYPALKEVSHAVSAKLQG
ncbi:MAG: FGGY family carbohydrate kinase [Spirochaetia bacterium]|jgi:xylulokinase